MLWWIIAGFLHNSIAARFFGSVCFSSSFYSEYCTFIYVHVVYICMNTIHKEILKARTHRCWIPLNCIRNELKQRREGKQKNTTNFPYSDFRVNWINALQAVASDTNENRLGLLLIVYTITTQRIKTKTFWIRSFSVPPDGSMIDMYM